MSTNPSKILIGGTLIAAAGMAIGFWIGGRHQAAADAAAVARAEKSASETDRAHHPDLPAKSSPPTPRDLHKLGIKIDPANIDGSLYSIRELTRPEEKMAAVRELLSRLPEDRWPEVLTNVWLNWDLTERDAALDYIAAGAPERCLSCLLGKNLTEESGMLLAAWAGHDLPGALAFFDAHSEKMLELSAPCAEVLAREYCRADPDAALRWIGALPDQVKEDATKQMLSVAAGKDVAAAVRLYESGPDYVRGGPQAEVIGRAWAASDPEAALKWAAGLPDVQGVEAAAAVIEIWAGRDFDAAFKAASMLSPEAQGPVLKGLAEGAATPESLAQVKTLIEALSEGKDQALAARQLVHRWFASDRIAAGAWVDGLPSGLTRDATIDRFQWPQKSDEFPTFCDRQATIQNPDARQSSLKLHVVSWLQEDPEAARAWVKESPKLTPEDREALLKITGK